MPKVTLQSQRANPYRYVLSDWAGVCGVFTQLDELADALHKLNKLPNSDVELDYTVHHLQDGLVTTKTSRHTVSIKYIMEQYPEMEIGYRGRIRLQVQARARTGEGFPYRDCLQLSDLLHGLYKPS